MDAQPTPRFAKLLMDNRRATIVTSHFPIQKRRGSILWICDEMRKAGWNVCFVTVGFSWISKVRGDKRFGSVEHVPKSGETVHDEGFISVFGYAPIHPFSTKHRFLDKVLRPFHRLFEVYWSWKLPKYVRGADLVLIESGQPITLAKIVSREAGRAALVYRVNDDARILGLPSFVEQAEIDYARLFDRISVASPHLARRFEHLETLKMDPMGVPKQLLDSDLPDPFAGAPRAAKEAVCAGTTQFDMEAVQMMALIRPNWNFHIFGRLPDDMRGTDNVILHGEKKFVETAAWVKHADIGLAPYKDKLGVEYQTAHSNRMLMYRYLGLPMIGPKRLCDPTLPNLIGYTPNDENSMVEALCALERLNISEPDSALQDWSALYERIASTERRR